MAALQSNQKRFVDCTNHSLHKLLCWMWLRNKKTVGPCGVSSVWSLQSAGVQTFWLTASSVVQFPALLDVFNTLHLCYLTRLPWHCSGSVMQGCCFSNLCSVHREIGICMWIAFLLPLMWGMIAGWAPDGREAIFFPSFLSDSFETKNKRLNRGSAAALLQ